MPPQSPCCPPTEPTVPAAPIPASSGGGGEEALEPRTVVLLWAQMLQLQSGEIIILMLKPSLWYVLLESLRGLFGLAAVFGLLILASLWSPLIPYLNSHDLILVALLLAIVRLVWQFLDWMGRMYVLTDRRVVTIQGILRVQIFEAPLKQIQHTITLFSLRERLFGLGTIGFATAGTAFTESYWRMLVRPLEVHQRIIQALNRYR